ncbi:peptide ligase PGM1-related protein [Streptomyces sp. PSRA5]|uniref:preATP grasp domain-containing protein n=1 Tax=Streptomyces panacea TaxID=3035064 RepID=UPI00339D1700
MPRLLIANCFTDELAGDTARLPQAHLQTAAASSHLLLWFARDGDVIVLPVEPEDDLLAYITSLTRTDVSTLRLLTPPPGQTGTELLTAARLADEEFRGKLRKTLDGEPVDTIIALTPDAGVASLARFLGAEKALPGYEFISQGGGTLVNSKAVFRAVAAGAGVPLPEGAVCTNRQDAENAIMELLDQGHPAMLKRDFSCGGLGNEILSPVPGLEPVGAGRLLEIAERAAVREYLDERWMWLTNEEHYPAVIERYFPNSRAITAEFIINDHTSVFSQQGEMFSAPIANAQVIPAPELDSGALAVLVSASGRMCESLRSLGYRGFFCADAVLTEDGEVRFTEYNGRITGSTHLYSVIGEHVVGPGFAGDRLIAEYSGWPVPSFPAAVARLAESGFAYDPGTRTGVVLTKAYSRADGTVRYCVVAEDIAAAGRIHDQVESLFL